MLGFRIVCMGAIAAAAIVVGGQRASAQYYGYASGQAPMPSGQAGVPCQPCQACHGCVPPPPPPCQPEKCGCNVVYCPPTACQGSCISDPPIEHPPGCQAACVITDECAPSKPPIWVTVYRNHYVPIRIEKKPTPYDVQPVNIQVKQRIVHYLCDCAPGTPTCPHIPTAAPQMGAEDHAAQPDEPRVASADSGSEGIPAAATARATNPASPAPAVTLTAQPQMQWAFIAAEGVYVRGYQRADGSWIVDPATKTKTPPVASTDSSPKQF